MSGIICCPHCYSRYVVTKNIGRKVGAAIGATGGAVKGVTGALAGARVGSEAGVHLGARLGIMAGPAGITLGTVAGAVIGGIVGATTFGFMGAKLGELIDNTILDNYKCKTCGQSFNPNHFMAEMPMDPYVAEHAQESMGIRMPPSSPRANPSSPYLYPHGIKENGDRNEDENEDRSEGDTQSMLDIENDSDEFDPENTKNMADIPSSLNSGGPLMLGAPPTLDSLNLDAQTSGDAPHGEDNPHETPSTDSHVDSDAGHNTNEDASSDNERQP
ncbi:MAG: hypothetical protein ACRCWR_07145 [Saezia sp.]